MNTPYRTIRPLRTVGLCVAIALLASCATGPRYRSAAMIATDQGRDLARAEIRFAADPRALAPGELTTAELHFGQAPGLTFHADVELSEERITAYLGAMEFLATWPRGWTWGWIQTGGVVICDVAATELVCEVSAQPSFFSLERGEIRYFDEYLVGADGLTRVQARFDRAVALADWLAEQQDARLLSARPLNLGTGPDLNATYQAALAAAAADDEVPEWLVRLVESGTVDRDLTEASMLVAALYNIDTVVQSGPYRLAIR